MTHDAAHTAPPPHKLLHAPVARRRTNDAPVTIERLTAARKTAANLVAQYGAQYLPVFDRIDTEIKTREAQSASMARALAIAGE